MGQRFAILADIHANIDALMAVIEDARSQNVTDFICAGDIVGYNAAPAECIRVIRELGCPVIVGGNHDFYCSNEDINLEDFQPNAASVVEWTRRQLSESAIKWLRELPPHKNYQGFGVVHSTLDDPTRWGYVFDTFAAESHFNYQQTTLCFHGHTHVPIIFEQKSGMVFAIEPLDLKIVSGTKYFVNVGSVGQPRDKNRDASYVIYDRSEAMIYFRRVPYDVETAAQRNRNAGLPERLATRLLEGR